MLFVRDLLTYVHAVLERLFIQILDNIKFAENEAVVYVINEYLTILNQSDVKLFRAHNHVMYGDGIKINIQFREEKTNIKNIKEIILIHFR